MSIHPVARRFARRDQQLRIPFPPLRVGEIESLLLYAAHIRAQKHADMTLWQRKPSEWPRGWFRMAQSHPDNWRVLYRRQWHERRLAQGLPGLSFEELNATNAPLHKQRLYPIGRGRKTA